MDIEIRPKRGVKDKQGKILVFCITILSEFYTVYVNGEKWSDLIKRK